MMISASACAHSLGIFGLDGTLSGPFPITESLYEPLFLAVYCQPKNFTSEGNPIHKPTGNAVFYIMLPLFVLAHFSHHLVSALLTPLLPFIRDTISFDYTRAGFLVFAYNIAYGGSQLPGGWLGDRLGFRTLITIGISGVALAGFLFGFSSGFSMMVIILLFMGIMGGGYHPSASPLISSIVEKKYRGRALGIHQVGGTASFFLAPLIAVGIARVLGWRGCFFSLSTPTLIYGIVLFLLLGSWGFGTVHHSADSGGSSSDEERGGRTGSLVSVIVLNSLLQIFVYSSISFIPFFVVDHLGGSKEAAALLLSLSHSAGLWAGPLGGFLSDRFGRIPILLFTGLIAGPLIILLGRVSLGLSISIPLLLIGMTMYMSMPVTEAYVISHAADKNRSTFLGIYYFASRGGPGLMAPALGRLIDTSGFPSSFTLAGSLLTAAGVACVAVLLIMELSQRRARQ
jgi:MFS family permease